MVQQRAIVITAYVIYRSAPFSMTLDDR